MKQSRKELKRRIKHLEAEVGRLKKQLSEIRMEEVHEAFARLEEKEADLKRVQRLKEKLLNRESGDE